MFKLSKTDLKNIRRILSQAPAPVVEPEAPPEVEPGTPVEPKEPSKTPNPFTPVKPEKMPDPKASTGYYYV